MDKGLQAIRERLNFFLENNIKAFIIDNSENYYFCNIIDIKDVIVTIKSFTGKRTGQIDELLLIDIKEIKLYKDKQWD